MKLLMIPGMDGTGQLFAPLVRAINNRVETRSVGLPSEGPQNQTALAERIYDSLPKRGPFVLMGESFGGRIAYELATKKPEGLEGVIFAASFLEPPRRYLLSFAAALPLQNLIRTPGFSDLARVVMFGRGSDSQVWHQFHMAIRSLPQGLIATRIEGLKRAPAPEAMLDLPCLQLRATSDKLIDRKAAASISARISNLRTKDIKGPHFLLQTRAETCAREIVKFMQKLV